jgi:hypothetical protein
MLTFKGRMLDISNAMHADFSRVLSVLSLGCYRNKPTQFQVSSLFISSEQWNRLWRTGFDNIYI